MLKSQKTRTGDVETPKYSQSGGFKPKNGTSQYTQKALLYVEKIKNRSKRYQLENILIAVMISHVSSNNS